MTKTYHDDIADVRRCCDCNHVLRPNAVALGPDAMGCYCCGRLVWLDAGGWSQMQGPRHPDGASRFGPFVCDDCEGLP